MRVVARQRRPAGPSRATGSSGESGRFFERRLGSLRGGGRPLSEDDRAFFEPRFGRDLSAVRVHDGPQAAEAAAQIEARAFTTDRDVVFADGEYAPQSGEGRRLLAHELAHVVQQGSARADGGPAVQRQGESPKEKLAALLRAAERARRHRGDSTRLMINGAEIVYRLIDLYLPSFRDRVSGVSFSEELETIRAEAPDTGGLISITVGKKFILGTNSGTVGRRTAELALELASRAKVAAGEPPLRAEGGEWEFRALVWGLLDKLMTSPMAGLRRLYEAFVRSPVPIVIRSITNDTATWHRSDARKTTPPAPEDRRSHTDPVSRRRARRGRQTGSTIFINPYRLVPSDDALYDRGTFHYERGTFVHELVHAVDAAYGRYDSSTAIRERRAVFFQNMWRHALGTCDPATSRGCRNTYTRSSGAVIATDDYQKAVTDGRVAAAVTHLLSSKGLPASGGP